MPPRRTLLPLERSEGPSPSHELAGIGEPGEVADLCDHGCRDDQTDPAHRLHGLDHRRHRPAGQELLDLALQALQPHLGVLDRMDGVLQHDLLAG